MKKTLFNQTKSKNNNQMGQTQTQFQIPSFESLKSDRIIDNENDGIYVGIIGTKTTNPLTSQAIRFGWGPLYRLEYFEKSDTNLTYKFESNTELKFYKTPESEIIVSYSNPNTNLNVTKKWLHKDFWKNPSWGPCSAQLDEIGKLIDSTK